MRYIVPMDIFHTLQEKYIQLQAEIDRVDALVDRSKRNGEVFSPKVKDWYQLCESTKNKADDLIERNRSHDFSCWIVRLGYRNRNIESAKALCREIDDLVNKGATFTRESVYEVMYRPLPATLAYQYVAIPSRENYLKVIKDALVGAVNQKYLIRLYGDQGVGKTTLLKKLAVEIENLDEFKVVLMSAEVLKDPEKGMPYIQDLIADCIGFVLTSDDIQQRASKVRESLSNIGKVLLIIDDVEETTDLTKIGFPRPSPNCRIVVVSKSLCSICEMMTSQMKLELEVLPLSQDELMDLFHEWVKQSKNLTICTSNMNEVKAHISSKPKWLPGEINDYFHDTRLWKSPPAGTAHVISTIKIKDINVDKIKDILQETQMPHEGVYYGKRTPPTWKVGVNKHLTVSKTATNHLARSNRRHREPAHQVSRKHLSNSGFSKLHDSSLHSMVEAKDD